MLARELPPCCWKLRGVHASSARALPGNAPAGGAASRQTTRCAVAARRRAVIASAGEKDAAGGVGGEEEGALGGEAAVLAGGAGLALVAAGAAAALHGVDDTLASAREALESFAALVATLGPLGQVLYVATYAGLELVLLPATPLALLAASMFGLYPGLLLSSAGGLTGATTAFLLSRYALRERVVAATRNTPQFKAIDRAIERDAFKVVLLINLSPLASLQNILNYVYGTTSVELGPYMAASYLALLPRTYATVAAGYLGSSLLEGEGGGQGQLAVASTAAALVASVLVAKVAKQALDEMEAEDR